MKTAVRVRTATPADARAIAGIHVETWQAAYAGIVPDSYLVNMTVPRVLQHWRAILDDPNNIETVLVAEAHPRGERRRIVAFGSCGPERTSRLGYGGEVYTLYVSPDWQGEGTGGQLFADLLARVHKEGGKTAVVWVLAENPARFFYEHMGGQAVAHRRTPFAGEPLRETAYAWPDLAGWLAQMRG
ncbi:Ribosomal protein S18 acetylase RimI [Limimonas halophila]|uniref:Ribosomal protein S18 acetylase RimI n=1 Tax=Limimonas halophila TaxID=1082479 RepID=A0A1G7MDZ4_9PROT|nr:GNAT family N-acetyltransferase [Limimonas halophila]SDF59430.1 Ribosomal protein S18 acetylase RimI [Limimonas halophila]